MLDSPNLDELPPHLGRRRARAAQEGRGGAHMQAMMNMMMKVLKTGTMAVATAERILRRERKRPKRRRTRRARITRTMPVDVLARRRDTSDMATTKASNQYLAAAVRAPALAGGTRVGQVPAVGEQGNEPVGEGGDAELEGEEDGEEDVEAEEERAEEGLGPVCVFNAAGVLRFHDGAEEALRRRFRAVNMDNQK